MVSTKLCDDNTCTFSLPSSIVQSSNDIPIQKRKGGKKSGGKFPSFGAHPSSALHKPHPEVAHDVTARLKKMRSIFEICFFVDGSPLHHCCGVRFLFSASRSTLFVIMIERHACLRFILFSEHLRPQKYLRKHFISLNFF